ncbi:MAG: hypothetical protein E6R07_14725 [Nevskiaceae bacterium]|nr:MAG: hypothetical protein E6R07_14725 [Nevskiaceae bacterium]
MNRLFAASIAAAVCAAAGCSSSSTPQAATPVAVGNVLSVPAKAVCGPGAIPETGIQGRVSREDHTSGAAKNGFKCNTEVVGSYTVPDATGTVGGFKVERYTDAAGHDCAYYDSTLLFPTNLIDNQGGVKVLDMSDPTKPTLTASLMTPAMLSPHESLVVSKQRGVLAAVLGNPTFGPGVVDVYDISQDCRNPVFKSSTPLGVFGHESGMAPDGKTFYSASPFNSTIVALDISNESAPVPVAFTNVGSHGLSISADGNRAYVASIKGQTNAAPFSGLIILDTSEIQARKPLAQFHEISRLTWASISIPQNAIPITIKGHPYLVEIDEYTSSTTTPGGAGDIGAGRIIDIGDEKNPKVISNLRLEIQQPQYKDLRANDPGANIPVQGYGGHYCNVPTRVDPTIVACSMIISGLRVFDIRDPANPKEIAYFNAPENPRVTPVFETSNWAMSSPSFVPERKEIWYTDGYSGFYAVRLTNNAWPSN